MSHLDRPRRGDSSKRFRRTGGRRRPRIEALEERQLLTGPSASIDSIAINLSNPGPTSISGTLNPGNEVAVYRIDGSAGEVLQFHSLSTSSTNGGWELVNEANQEVAGTALGTDFGANLTYTAPYYLYLFGNTAAAITYSFQVSDASTYPTPAPSGSVLNTPQSASLANGAAATFTFMAPGGLPIYLNSLGANSSMYAQLQAPGGSYVFQSYFGSNNLGPYLLPATGTYTFKVTNNSGATGTYNFDLLALPTAATSLATGPTQTVSGTISNGLGAKVYSFLGAQGERLFVDNELPYSGPGALTLYEPDGGQVFSGSSYSDGGPLSLTENGTYYLIVQGTSSASLNYQFRLTDTAYAPLTFGAVANGTITNAVQSDVYSFTGTAGQHVYFHELSSSNGYYGASWDLYGPNNAYITSNYIGGDLPATLPASGNYTLVVYNNTSYSSGTYSFEAYQNANPTASLTLGQEYTGSLTNPGDTATFTFTGAAGQGVYFDSHVATSGLDATLTSAYGTQVFSDYLPSGGQGPYILPQSGTYTLTISGSGASVGKYDFLLDDASKATTIAMTPGSGATESGTLATGYATDLYQFSGNAGQIVFFQGQQDSPGSAAVAWLYAPGASGDNSYTTYTYLENSAQWTLPATGTYLIAVRGQGNTTGTVSYKFTLFDNVVPTTAMTLGTEYTGTLTNPGDQHKYTFTGSIGQQVWFDPRDQASGIYAQLTYPSGGNVFTGYFSSGDAGPYTLNQAGTYTLTIYGNSTSTGAYDFSLDDLAKATTIALTAGSGTTVSGTLATGLTTNLYTFTGTAGQRIYFQGQQDSTPSTALAILYSPSGNYITELYTESSAQWTLPGSGTYLLAVYGNNASATGTVSYKFTLYDNTNPTKSLTLGTEYTGTLANPGDEVTYTFTGTGGQRIYWDPRDQTQYVAAILTSPTGGSVFNSYFSNNDQGPYILNQAGTYTLTIYANYGYTGAYDFSLDDTSKATTLPIGSVVNGTLATGLATNLYQFSGTVGQRIYFDGLADSVANGAYATLYSPSNNYVTAFYLENKAQVTLPSTGTYVLAVAGVSAATTGTITYQFEAFNNVNPTTSMTLGTEYTGTLANPGDEASFTFAGAPGQQVWLDSRALTSGLYAQLVNPSGGQVFNFYMPYNDSGIYVLNQAGTYTLTVYGSGLSAGAYDFSLDDIAKAPTIALTSGSGTVVSGTLATGLTTNLYTFSGTAGQRIYFQGQQDAPGFSTLVQLYGPGGNYISQVYAENSAQWTLPSTGTYIIAAYGVNSSTTGTVSYKFTLFDNVNPTTTLTALGTAQSGTLANPGDEATYTFTGSPGQRIFYDGQSAASGIDAYFTNPSGNAIFNIGAAADAGIYILSEPGTYTLTIYGNGNTGSYAFNLLDASAKPVALSTTATTVSGTLSPGTAAAIYQFAGTAGETVTLQNSSFSSTSGNWYLIDPNNNNVFNSGFSTASGTVTTQVLPVTGPYEVALLGSDTAHSSVTYSFAISGTPAASATPSGFGTTHSGNLPSTGSTATFTYNAPAGLPVFLDTLTNSNGYLYATLKDPNNNIVFQSYASSITTPYILPASGTYTLTLTSENGSINYSVDLIDLHATATALTLGSTTSGTLNPGNSIAAYSFTGSVGQNLFLDNQVAAGAAVNLEIMDPYSKTILNIPSSSDGGPLTLTSAGTYYLLAVGSATTAVGYQFRLIDTSTVPLTFGSPISRSYVLTQTDPASLTGTAGEQIYIHELSSSNGYYGTYWTLYGPNNQAITSAWLGNDLSVTLPASGNYTLTAGDNNGYASGTYSFEAYQNVNPTASLTLGTETTGTLTNPGDTATFTFTGAAGQGVYFDSHVGTSGLDDTLTSAYGTQVFSNALSNGGQGPYILPQSGTYTLTISGSGASVGKYDFLLDDASKATTIAMTPGSGATESGTLATGYATDLYQFSGNAGQIVFFQGQQDSPGSAAVAYLFAPGASGFVPYTTYTYLENSAQWTLPATGTYLIAVRGQGNTTGTVSYKFTLFDSVNPTTGLTLGQEYTGSLANPGDRATFTFTGSMGQKIWFDSRDQASGIYAYLVDPYGNVLINNAFSGDEGPFTLSYSGTYTFIVYPSGSSTGAFDFSLDDVGQATTIAMTPGSGTAVSGTLATGLTTNLYTFTGTAGQRIYFQGHQDTPGSSAVVYLYGPGNNYVTSVYTENSTQWTLPYTGSYTLAVIGNNASATSGVSYKFTLYDNTDPTSALTLGQDISGTIVNPGDEFSYTFTGSLGQRIWFDSRDATTGIDAILTSPYGDTVFTSAFSSGDVGPYTLTQAGTYTLTVYGNGYTGAFDFALDDLAKATPLTFATVTNGTLAAPLTTDLYTFTAAAGQSIFFDGLADSPANSAIAYFYSPTNGYITSIYTENSGVVTLRAAGTYLLAVIGNGNASGSVAYSFEVFANIAPTTALTLGQEYTGTLANPGDKASYTFTGAPGQQVWFDPRVQTSGLYAQLNNPSGAQVYYQYFSSGDYGPVTLNQAGTYTFTIYGSGLSVGAFDFSLDDVGKATALALTPGSATPVAGSLPTGLTTNLYTFTGTAGQRIYFQGQQDAPGSSTLVQLYGPGGNYISQVYAENSAQWTLPGTGTYIIAAYGVNSTTTSSVSYRFTLFDNVNSTAPLTLNSEVTGGLANPGDQAIYTFTGSIGQQVQFNGLSPTTSGQYARLYDPLGNQVFGQYLTNNAGPYTLTTPGTYSLVVTTNGAYTGPYDFRLLDLASSPKLQVGATEGDLTVTLSSAPTQQVLIQYATGDGTATAAAGRYKPATGLLLFQPGQTTATVEVQAVDVNTTQNSTFNVNLSGPVGATISQGTGVVTINANAGTTFNGEVFNDLNGDGTLGGGEPGLSGVTVNLLNSSNTVVNHTTTAANGTYSFTAVAPGTYTIAEVLPSGYIQTAPPTPGTYSETVTSGQNVTVNNLNFGDFQGATIGGQVFNDVNGDGVQQGGDGGLSGWTVDLLNSANSVVATATTNSSGNYAFTGVGPGTYTVQLVLQSRYLLTTSAASYTEHPTSGQSVANLNFGAFQLATVGGEVFSDTNGNGVLNTGEPGLSGWTVYLGANSLQLATTIYPSYTDNGTSITFSGTPLGTVSGASLLFGTQTGFNWHPFGASSFGADTRAYLDIPTSGSYTFQLNSDDGSYLFIDGNLVVNDGGVHNASTVSGTVSLTAGFHSFEMQFFENGSGASGVDFAPPVGVLYAQSATTNAQGLYSFSGVGPGSYTIQLVQQSGFTPTSPNPLSGTATSGLNFSANNFGEAGASTLGGEVFNDVNGNGVLDTGDPGLAGVTVNLLNSSNAIVATTTTASNGAYSFVVTPGTYTVQQVAPNGDVQTLPASGGYTETVGSGQSVANLNFGDFQTVSLGGEVFNDLNGNGALDGGEPGIAGWTVTVLNSAHSPVASGQTDSHGDYSFSGIGPGTYTIQLTNQTGYVLTEPLSVNYTETTSSGQNVSGLDFGVFQQVTLGGEVFNDVNGNGVIDSGDPGLSGWTVDLLNASNQVVTTKTTDSNGNYAFTVGPGRFTLEVVAQSGYALSTVGSYTTSTTSGVNASGFNFGEFQTATLGGEVFNDANGNGVLNTGDAGIAGWTVNLYNKGGFVGSTTTDTHGNYTFTGVGPGSYTVTETLPSGYIQTTTPTSYTGTPTGGQVITGLDFGIFQLVTYSGEAFNDLNGNGALDTGEPGMSGLTVDLLNASNQVVASKTTDSNGDYVFSDVGPGSYTIREATPSGYVLTLPASGTYAETAASGQNAANLDFGNFQKVAIGGEVFNDLNGNGKLDTGDPGLANWTVNLLNGSNQTVATATTDSSGNYAFSQVGPGTYTLQIVQQSGYTATTSKTLQVTVTSGTAVTGENFGEFQIPTVSGEVFNDTNGNGVFDGGEPGLAGVTVKLLNSSNMVVATTTTASNGSYSLPITNPGTYTVQEVVPSGYVQTAPASKTFSVTAVSGQDATGNNFGDFQTVTISGEVFNDTNGNGALDTGEPGIAGVTVKLINNATHAVTSQVTASGGTYSFSGIGPGSYTVEQVTPSGYVQTSTPTTYLETTSSGTNLPNLNFGDFQAATISGEVFNDTNGNGALDTGEPGIAGWTVDLVSSSNAVVASTTTDSNGKYSFTGVAAGNYKIEEVQQSGYSPTTATAIAVTATSGLVSTGNNFGEFVGPSLSGEVFNDVNGNGVLNTGDAGIPGWVVELRNGSNAVIATATTDTNGDYSFTGVAAGTYTLDVQLQSGYTLTTPAGGTYTETITSGQGASGLDFGAFKQVAYSGEVFNDANGNGALDTGEPGLSGWTVELRNSANAVVASATTGTGGTYSFTGVGPGTYTLDVQLQSGYTLTAPAGGTYSEMAASGQDVGGLNFGAFQQVTLSGEVFDDANDDGKLDNGEAGLSGWTVDLLNGSSQTVATTTTGTGGTYSFSGVGPGSYSVQVVAQSGYTATTPTSIALTTSSGQNVTGLDFGEFPGATISGEVFDDLSGSGVLQAGDPGIPGWTVNLYNATNQLVATTTTLAGGTFSFGGIAPGSYTVTETPQSGYVATTATSFPATITGGKSVSGLDFGIFQLVTYSGEAFDDLNGNGAFDTGEPGMSGLTVDLLNASNQVVASKATDSNGDYVFSDVGPGSYTIREATPSGYVLTLPASGSYAETAASGQNAADLDFGNFQQVALSGEVYGDVNGNGALDAGESGLSGWTVDLLNSSDTVVATQTTDSQGTYSFTGIGPGTYTVSVVPQSSYLQTSSPTNFTVTTSSGRNRPNVDFGEFLTASFLGRVFDDANANGKLDTGESGLSGWTVDLLDSSSQTVATTTTNSLGNYSFSGVGPGSYTIREITQSGYTATTPTTLPVTATYGLSSMANLFGEFQDVTLGGEVFNDLNGNGALDTGETGLSGWTVDLVNAQNQTVAATTVSGGTYSFSNVGPGPYTVKVVGQSGYVATTATSLPVTPTSGQNVSSLNFGEFQTVTLSGEVYNDLNANGAIDSGEAGFSGWTVNLLNAQNQVIQTTTTDANGNYSFSNVGPDARTIQEVTQTGPGGVPYVPTVPSTGTIALLPTSGTNASALNFGNILKPQVVDIRVDYGSKSMSLLGLNRDLPFVNINAIEVIFNENVSVTQGDLALSTLIKSGVTYNFNSFSYNSTTHDARWTLPSAIGVDSLMLALDGHHSSSGTDGVHVGSGIYLGDISQEFSVLPGDVNGDKMVSAQDVALVQLGIIKPQTATVWEDVDGSGTVDFTDYNDVRKWLGKSLP